MLRQPQRDQVVARDALRRAMILVAVSATAAALLALPARASSGGRLTADEPQYVLSAISLAEDLDLDIGDELADDRAAPFHRAQLPVQTATRDDGRAISPHDPLLPVLLAPGVALGGWVGAKATLALFAGLLAALTLWVAVRRLRVGLATAALVVGGFSVTAPLTAYGAQVYPELPAALLVVVAIAGLTAPAGAHGARVAWVLGVIGLPWLGVKYVPVAAAVALCGLVPVMRQRDRRGILALGAAFAVAGVVYVLVHRAVYGGWTVYAAGDHFVGGELTVVGNSPNYLGRSQRLAALLVDRDFGLLAWNPLFLLAAPAALGLVVRRPRHWATITLPLAAGWATATWIALTMHGWWWPGRQTVVVVPSIVLAVAWATDRAAVSRRTLAVLVAGGLLVWGDWLRQVVLGGKRLIVDVDTPSGPVVANWRTLFPDFRGAGPNLWLLTAWALASALLTFVVVRRIPRSGASASSPPVIPTVS